MKYTRVTPPSWCINLHFNFRKSNLASATRIGRIKNPSVLEDQARIREHRGDGDPVVNANCKNFLYVWKVLRWVKRDVRRKRDTEKKKDEGGLRI